MLVLVLVLFFFRCSTDAGAVSCGHGIAVAAQRSTLPPTPLLGCRGYPTTAFVETSCTNHEAGASEYIMKLELRNRYGSKAFTGEPRWLVTKRVPRVDAGSFASASPEPVETGHAQLSE